MMIQQLAARLCDDLVREVASVRDRHFIITAFSYPNGDSVNVYLTSDETGEPCLSDLGTTMQMLRVAGVSITDHRKKVIENILSLYSVRQDRDIFTKQMNDETAPHDFLAFCEALVRISDFEFSTSARTVSPLPPQVEFLIQNRVRPKRSVHEHWYVEPDHRHLYPVDYHCNTRGEGRNLFVVSSRAKSLFAVAAMLYFKSQRLNIPAMSVVDPDVHGKDVERLEQASDSIVFGVSGNEETIVRFALTTTNQ